jgi:Cd2+/Zn2+-exporting ATPase
MDCPHESGPIIEMLRSLPGFHKAIPSFSESTLAVDFDPHAVSTDAIVEAIAKAGFRARVEERQAGTGSFLERHGRLLATSFSGAFIVIGYLVKVLGGNGILNKSFFLAAAVAGAWYVAPLAWQALRHRRLEMNVLMTTAAIGALGIGDWAEAASAMFLFSLAQYLEARTMDRARHAIRKLLDLSPKEATVLSESGESRVPVERVAVGDRVLLRPGERVPMDGTVLAGVSDVNQAPITGESIPVSKSPGSAILAGSLNGRGVLEIRASRPSSDSAIARIIHLVEVAQEQRAPSQSFVERFSRYYTPAMVLFAAGIAILPPLFFGQPFSDWLYRGLVVLVISCPCALVISTPVSVVCGLTRAARGGVLFKGGVHLEELGKVRTFFFDKTGTLTSGKPGIAAIRCYNGLPESELLRLSASLESRSEHPIGEAILVEARSRGLDYTAPTFVQALPGKGIRGRIDGTVYQAGHRSMFELVDAGIPETAWQRDAREWESQGATVVVFGTEKEVLGAIAVRDAIRKEAPAALAALRRLGVETLTMLTGDNPATGAAIGSVLSLDAVHAGLLPEQKVERIREAVGSGQKVAMVGDGINDAPALALATVGVVMGGGGTDVALEAGDVALMGDDLRKLPFAVKLGRRTLRIIRFNVVFALLSKIVFIVLATLGMATLWMGVAADMGASLLVIANSMRLLLGSPSTDQTGEKPEVVPA